MNKPNARSNVSQKYAASKVPILVAKIRKIAAEFKNLPWTPGLTESWMETRVRATARRIEGVADSLDFLSGVAQRKAEIEAKRAERKAERERKLQEQVKKSKERTALLENLLFKQMS